MIYLSPPRTRQETEKASSVMINPDKLPEDIYMDLVERGVTPADFENFSAEKMFCEYCNWHGLHGWGAHLAVVLDKIREASQ